MAQSNPNQPQRRVSTFNPLDPSNGVTQLERLSDGTFKGLTLFETVGVGSRGRVVRAGWKASEAEAPQDVAVKYVSLEGLNPTEVEHQALLTRMNNRLCFELHSWVRLRHKRITPVLAYALCDTFGVPPEIHLPVLVTPYRPGHDLMHFLTKVKPDADRLVLLQQAMEGLAYLHAFDPQIVHSDFKPGNIIVNAQGEAELCDFGLAKAIGEGLPTGFSSYNTNAAYTMKYSAPEILFGEPDNDDEVEEDSHGAPKRTPQADVFCAGSTVLHVMSGVAPFPRASMAKIPILLSSGSCPHKRKDHPISGPEPAVDRLWALMKQCWATAELRPAAEEVVSELGVVREMMVQA